ncbi:MAG TPA: FKBP-type peptidyl-prolyl cis-trans isomerase [Candidatus Paceibacterota bacterium]|nr:FKBP-type peptidyl-prolyl cis-trans isomerase [Candidatus Paceibacterota bacterium]HRY76835.1 FKBP-type peptidyl-prolyl cis-trans isomerase [Candidatus Paceibacterota bacterium]
MNKKIIIIALIFLVVVVCLILLFEKKVSGPTTTPTNTPGEQNNLTKMNKDGVVIEILKPGDGAEAKSGDKVTVNYVGTLENGQKFDASADHGEPYSFNLGAGKVIQGWDIGVAGMKVGEKRRLIIPPELGYGVNDLGVIPPNSTLIFEIDLLKIN